MGQDEVRARILRTCEWVAVIILVGAGCFLGGSNYGWDRAVEGMTAHSDTVTKVVPMWKDRPEPAKTARLGYVAVPSVYFLTDTINVVETAEIRVHDTIPKYVYLPREQKYYEEDEGRLRMWISGYDPCLDRYEFDKQTKTITKTVVPSRWGISVQGGYGLSIANKAPVFSPYIGIGISYTILRL